MERAMAMWSGGSLASATSLVIDMPRSRPSRVKNGCLSTCMPAMATPSGRPWNVDYYQRASSCAVRGMSRTSVPGFEDDTDGMFTMEEGIFEDAFGDPQTDSVAEDVPDEYSGLVPEEWRPLQEELGKTKRQKKRDTLDMLEGRAKEKEIRRRMLREKQQSGSEATRQRFFPRVLPGDIGSSTTTEGSNEDVDDDEVFMSSSEMDELAGSQIKSAAQLPMERATPKNPRLALGEMTFEEMTKTLLVDEAAEEQPVEVESNYYEIETREVSGSKLLTAEEKELLKSKEIKFSKISSEKWHPLHSFVTSGQSSLVEALIRRGVDINARNMDGVTALHRAAIIGRDSMVRFLLKSGADVRAMDKAGATVLHYAAQTANTTLIKILLRHKADINATDNEGWTPLHVAVQGGRLDIIKLLISRGADITIQNKVMSGKRGSDGHLVKSRMGTAPLMWRCRMGEVLDIIMWRSCSKKPLGAQCLQLLMRTEDHVEDYFGPQCHLHFATSDDWGTMSQIMVQMKFQAQYSDAQLYSPPNLKPNAVTHNHQFNFDTYLSPPEGPRNL